MKTACISVQALYNKYGENLPSGNTVDVDSWEGYYDLRDACGNLVCMDGEECEVVYELASRMYKFANREGEFDTTFYLTPDEFKVATH